VKDSVFILKSEADYNKLDEKLKKIAFKYQVLTDKYETL
jgi:hypothetical protein